MGLMRPDDVDDGEIPIEAGQSGLKSDESGDVLPGVWREREPWQLSSARTGAYRGFYLEPQAGLHCSGPAGR